MHKICQAQRAVQQRKSGRDSYHLLGCSNPGQPGCWLHKHARNLNRVKHKPVQSFTCQKQHYVVKYRQASRPRHIRSWMASAACALLFGEFIRPGRLRAGEIEHEAARLRTLYQQGVRVPKVVLETPHYLVMEYCGINLARTLKHVQEPERTRLLVEVIDDLAEFHQAGHWHGGAQLRNLTLYDNRIYRIDFEEAAGMVIPIELAQAYDVILTLHSIIDHLDGDLELGASLLDRYFQAAPSSAVADSLHRLERQVGWWVGFKPVVRRLAQKHKDIQRALILTRLLQNR